MQIQQITEYLQGTNGQIDDALPDGVELSDLSPEQLSAIDESVFQCAECEWWFERGDESEVDNPISPLCKSCGG